MARGESVSSARCPSVDPLDVIFHVVHPTEDFIAIWPFAYYAGLVLVFMTITILLT